MNSPKAPHRKHPESTSLPQTLIHTIRERFSEINTSKKTGVPSEMTGDELTSLTIPQLYKRREEWAARSTPTAQGIVESGRMMFSLATNIHEFRKDVLSKHPTPAEANIRAMSHEADFILQMRKMGMELDYHSELMPEELGKKPCLLFPNHQRSGIEVFMVQGLTGVPSRIVLKDDLMKMPYFSDTLRGRGAIVVERNKLKDEKTRQAEIDHIAQEVVACMQNGESVTLFDEGTRSEDGRIATTPARRLWQKAIHASIDKAWAETGALQDGFQKVLVTLDTMGAFPDAPEEAPYLTRFRLGTPLGVRIARADGLSPSQINQRREKDLKEMLVSADLGHQQVEYESDIASCELLGAKGVGQA